jgi:hypothetical protein
MEKNENKEGCIYEMPRMWKIHATNKTWGLCKSCYKIYLKIGPKNLP